MNLATSVTDSELPTLQLLARELAEADAPELSSLDRIAALAGEIAARCRDGARRELLEQLSAGAQGIFQVAGDDVASRLSGSSLDELSALGVLLDEAGAARAAFSHVDARPRLPQPAASSPTVSGLRQARPCRRSPRTRRRGRSRSPPRLSLRSNPPRSTSRPISDRSAR